MKMKLSQLSTTSFVTNLKKQSNSLIGGCPEETFDGPTQQHDVAGCLDPE